ncbi:MAG: gtf1 [Microbacterium sp.]|jgi:glycosyltransferase involved in cell wall biosynthesis|nr:gtf1 [Microbacterium sp.]
MSSSERHRPQVIHIAESFAGGVSAAIRDYARNTPQFDHGLVYAPRSDAPMNDGDLDGFTFAVELPKNHFDRIRSVRRVIRENSSAIVHAHSSFGGLYARLAVRKGRTAGLFYTPHCYAFERRDVPALARLGFRTIEWLLAFNTTGFIACSRREASLSMWPIARARVQFVPNVPPREVRARAGAHRDNGEEIVVAAAGRLGEQKDPGYFIEVVRALRATDSRVRPVWVGGGDPELEARMRAEGIRVTGWLERAEGLEALRRADVYVHTASWEGFPLAILEAAGLGVPAMVRRIPAFEGLELPAMLEQPADAAAVWQQFATADARNTVAESMRSVLAGYTDDSQAHALTGAYAHQFARQDQEVTPA